MPEENDSETKTRRSQAKRELDAVGELIRILKPLSDEQRQKVLKAASVMIGTEITEAT